MVGFLILYLFLAFISVMRTRYFAIIVLAFLLFDYNITFAFFRSDSLYLKPFTRNMSARLLIGVKELSLSISNNSSLISSAPKVIYKPNNGAIGGVGVSYGNILISYYFKVAGTQLSDQKYGATSIADYQVNLTTRIFYFSAFHRSYNGFYVSRPSESYPNWSDDMPYPQRPDIKYATRGIETIVNLNPHRYSLNASLKLTEQQLRSVFSPLIYASYSLTSVSADSSLIPSHLQSLFFEGNEIHQSDFSGWTLMPGVSYSLVKSKWFFNPMIFSGIGYLHKEIHFENDGSIKNSDYYFRIGSRLNCGFNSKFFFSGVFIEWNDLFLPEKNLMIKTENFNVMLMVGLRF